jgi:hypothetical protein
MQITNFIDRKHKPIVDLESFCKLLTDNPTKQECFKLMIQEVADTDKPYFLNSFRMKYAKEIRYKALTDNQARFSCAMVSDVWKTCFAIGLFHRKRRGAEVKLSRKFILMLNEIADYWNRFLEAKAR